MPSALRSQVALWGLLACLLIPIGTSSLRGLTHILTCQEASAAPFTIDVPAEGSPTLGSSLVIERDPTGVPESSDLCGGLVMNIEMGSRRADRADMTLDITNNTEYGWRGSVKLQLDETAIPIDIGEISSGETETDTIEIHLEADRTYEIEGELLIGPS